MKTPLFAMLCLGLAGAWIAACSEDSKRACIPGETRICAGVGRCQGVEECLPDGSGYDGNCDCSGPPREGAAGTSNDPETLAALVGRACTDDAACGAGLTCFTSTSNDFLGGGPGNGYCSLACTTDAECTSVDRQSQCIATGMGSPGLCLRTCRSLNPTSVAENKCLGRRDVVCQSEAYLELAVFDGSRQDGWCYPQCGSDEDCPGRRCDLARGLCVDTVTSGLPIGAACSANEDCAGRICNALSGGQSFCSAPCVLGQVLGCGDGASGPRTAGCFRALEGDFLGSEGIGDVGFCIELCTQSSDCAQAGAGWECELTEESRDNWGSPGVCDVIEPADGGIDGGSGDASAPSVGDAG